MIYAFFVSQVLSVSTLPDVSGLSRREDVQRRKVSNRITLYIHAYSF
jgi:hypothetical protein